MKSRKSNKSKVYASKTGTLGAGLYAGVVIIDTSEIEDDADFGGMLHELKKLGIQDGEAYQIDNCGDLLMLYDTYKRCKKILKKFKAKAVNL